MITFYSSRDHEMPTNDTYLMVGLTIATSFNIGTKSQNTHRQAKVTLHCTTLHYIKMNSKTRTSYVGAVNLLST